ncbi:SCO2583 family membrane protein [Streptomyces corynorhini]|uniref:Uncharacterized protein n=1 Tax=Streptomyces corynorhini TaxID=2282652 RepID=A0A370BKA4_9ACTN|nr:hypothetical protein [Streptomyces corynorhini]RDG39765.1 hypothetical protein DVH02_02400 [Streptomyces corynorhini]
MAGHGDPPEGEPDGPPGAEDDEYRSVVFDESFIRAARLQEFSARERMSDHSHAVRKLPPHLPTVSPGKRSRGGGGRRFGNGPRQLLLLLLVLVLSFGTAVYLGLRNPYRPPPVRAAEKARISVIPLAPEGRVPGGAPAELLAHSPAARFRIGAEGITVPGARPTGDFAEGQVVAALAVVKDYLVASSLDPDVLMGRTVRPVRVLLDPEQQGQFDRSFTDPADDGRHDPIGWLVRFDPGKVALADSQVRVRGSMRYEETAPGTLEVTSDHVFVYALRPAGTTGPTARDAPPAEDASLFTVRRELRFRFSVDDLPRHQVALLNSAAQAGPQSCAADVPRSLRPLLAGERAKPHSPAATDPYTTGPATPALCGTLSPLAEPSGVGSGGPAG